MALSLPLQPDRPAHLRLAFLPDLRSSRAASAVLRGFLAEQGVAEKELFACELCLAEACNNAVEYSSDNTRDRLPSAEAVCSPTEIELRVVDHTGGFEWPGDSNPPVLPSPVSERGRGLFLIRSMMDEVSYLRGKGENVLVMRKSRRQGPSPTGGAIPAPATPEQLNRQLNESQRTMAGMARELVFRSETLSAVFRCCAELGRGGETAGFKDWLLGDLLHLTNSDWYVLRFVSTDGTLVPGALSDPDWVLDALPIAAGAAGKGSLEATVAATRSPAQFDANRSQNPNEPLLSVGAGGHGVIYPLIFGGEVVGTIAVGRRKGDSTFGDLQAEVVRTFAEFLAIQTVTLRHRRQEVHNRVYARELEIGRDIQRALLPVQLPQPPGFGLAGGWQAAREVGGDFYDAISLNDRTLLLFIADVMGKGVPAALFATNIRGILRGLSARLEDPALLLGRLNALLHPDLASVNMFITAVVALVDLPTRRVTVASAGHCPPLVTAGGDRAITALPSRGFPLGVKADTVYQSHSVILARPGTLLLYTDGLTEVRDEKARMYGQNNLANWLAKSRDRRGNANQIRDELVDELNRFRGDAPMADDQAFLLLSEDPAKTFTPPPLNARKVRPVRSALLPVVA